MRYKVIEGGSPNEITTKVNDLVRDGWKPVGGHQVVVRREQNRYSGQQHMDTLNQLEYTQTMVKEEPKKKVIEVDVMYYHPDNDETKKVYDEEGMLEEFNFKLQNILKND